jgi:hypothetical protein
VDETSGTELGESWMRQVGLKEERGGWDKWDWMRREVDETSGTEWGERWMRQVVLNEEKGGWDKWDWMRREVDETNGTEWGERWMRQVGQNLNSLKCLLTASYNFKSRQTRLKLRLKIDMDYGRGEERRNWQSKALYLQKAKTERDDIFTLLRKANPQSQSLNNPKPTYSDAVVSVFLKIFVLHLTSFSYSITVYIQITNFN